MCAMGATGENVPGGVTLTKFNLCLWIFPHMEKPFSRGIYSGHDFLSTVRDGSCPITQWEVCCEVFLNDLTGYLYSLLTHLTLERSK